MRPNLVYPWRSPASWAIRLAGSPVLCRGRNPDQVSQERFELSRSFLHRGLSPTRLPFRHNDIFKKAGIPHPSSGGLRNPPRCSQATPHGQLVPTAPGRGPRPRIRRASLPGASTPLLKVHLERFELSRTRVHWVLNPACLPFHHKCIKVRGAETYPSPGELSRQYRRFDPPFDTYPDNQIPEGSQLPTHPRLPFLESVAFHSPSCVLVASVSLGAINPVRAL